MAAEMALRRAFLRRSGLLIRNPGPIHGNRFSPFTRSVEVFRTEIDGVAAASRRLAQIEQ